MSLVKRGNVWWADFWHDGRRYQFSTRQTEKRKAKDVEDAAKAQALLESKGFVEPKPVAMPALGQFIRDSFEPWCRARFEPQPTLTWANWYKPSLGAILAHAALADKPLDKITDADAAAFAATRTAEGLAVNSVNAQLRVLRRVLKAAAEWGKLTVAPRIRLLAGARQRERVVSVEEESRYLKAAPPLLSDLTVLLVDEALRLGEALALRWECITFQSGKHGSLFISRGKTKAARRLLPLTARVRAVLERRWREQETPETGWVWPALSPEDTQDTGELKELKALLASKGIATKPTRSGHVERSTLRKMHQRVFAKLTAEAKKRNEAAIEPWDWHTLRHTALTRLASAGVDPLVLMRVAGHTSLRMVERYTHLGQQQVADAFERLQPQLTATVEGERQAYAAVGKISP